MKRPLEEINEALEGIVTKATLPQAVRIALHYLKDYYPTLDAPELTEKIRYRANPSLSFQKSEIANAELKRNDDGVYVELTLNFLSIFGSASPLPSHYSETVLRSTDGEGPLRDFLDLFNHRLERFVYPVWLKHRYYIQHRNDLGDDFSKYVLSLMGLYGEHGREQRRLKLRKLLPYAGILGIRTPSSGILLTVLRRYLGHERIAIEQCVAHTVPIPEWQQCALGSGNCSLGMDFLAGETVTSLTGKFRIRLLEADWEELMEYGVHGERMGDLRELMDFVLREPFKYEVILHVPEAQVTRCELASKASGYLGINTVIGLPQGDLDVNFAS